jgi:hypothetical protein
VPAAAQQPGQKTFPSAEAASRALAAAAEHDDEKAMLDILGPAGRELISSGDSVEDLDRRLQFFIRYQQTHRLTKEPDGTMTLDIGPEDRPTPIPLANNGGGWYFVTGVGRQEILSRRIGKNEVTAIRACHDLFDAQILYFIKAHPNDAVKQYAQRFVSDEGKHNGLWWEGAIDEFESPGDPLETAAGNQRAGKNQTGDPLPFKGYYFRILISQGNDAPGGAKNYIVNGKMTGGFAFLAYPAEYGSSGVMTFMVDQDGTVYQKDLGPNTVHLANALTQYDPDSTWVSGEGREKQYKGTASTES